MTKRTPDAGGYGTTVRLFLVDILTQLTRLMYGLVTGAVGFIDTWLTHAKHARYGLAVTRILLALTGMGLLLANFRTRYYAFGSGSAWNGEAAEPLSDFPKIWIFSLFHRLALNDFAFTAAYVGLFILAVLVLLGWRTKIVLPVYFVGWVSFIEMIDSLGDQGDNMYRMVLLYLLVADTSGRWSLDARRRARADWSVGSWIQRKWRGEALLPAWGTNLAHNLILVIITCHVCFVYVSGALYKAGGTAWQEGYAIYNPLQTQRFGTWPELSDLLGTWAPVVTIISWSSIILQMFFPLMLLKRMTRVIALFGILSFHIGIAVLMGLPWFSLSMVAVDAIFIRDLTWKYVFDTIRNAWARARSRVEGGPTVRGGSGPARIPVSTDHAAEPLGDSAGEDVPRHPALR